MDFFTEEKPATLCQFSESMSLGEWCIYKGGNYKLVGWEGGIYPIFEDEAGTIYEGNYY